jgi:TRAP-type C4-dicarboxylate transport system permease small subunit
MAVSMGLNVPASGAGDRPGWLQAADRGLRVIEWVFETLALTALGLMMLLTVANAALRHVIQTPIPGSLNITLMYLMPALVFLGLGRVQAMNSHIAATLFVDRWSPTTQRFAKIVVTVVIIVVVAIMVNGASSELGHVWGKTLGGSPALPIGPSWIFVPIGLAVVGLRAIWQLLILGLVPGDPGVRQDPNAPAEMGGKEKAAAEIGDKDHA